MKTKSESIRSKGRFAMGCVACGGYAVHAGYHVLNGTSWDALWVCHVAALAVGVGLIGGWPRVVGAGLLAGTIGLGSWLLYLLSGQPLIPTSLLTHVMGPAIAVAGLRRLGLPRKMWLAAWVFVAGTTLLSRFVTPAEANVNLAFRPDPNLSLWKVQGAAHWALLAGQWVVGLIVVQAVWSFFFRRLTWPGMRESPGAASAEVRVGEPKQ